MSRVSSPKGSLPRRGQPPCPLRSKAPGTARNAPGGFVYHVLNRACGRATPLEKEGDYDAFERVIDYAMGRDPTRVLGYIVVPNHRHFALWPREDGELTRFVRRPPHTHV